MTSPSAAAGFDPRSHFPRFYANPVIAELGANPRWTISGEIDDRDAKTGERTRSSRKAPLDARELIDRGRVRGAWALTPECLVDLDELTSSLPLAANCAYYVKAQEDGYAILDIEKTCPPAIARRLLDLPGTLYREVSMSGRGFHLLIPIPATFHDHEIAARKRVLRERHGWFELLLDHFSTFTRQSVTRTRVRELEADAPAAAATLDDDDRRAHDALLSSGALDDLEALYAFLAADARGGAAASSTAVEIDMEDREIPYAEEILDAALPFAEPRLRSPEEFDHDLSRWEFSVLGTLHGCLLTQVSAVTSSAGITYTPGDVAWLLFMAARQVLPERPKHSQLRHGRPYLLDRAAALVAEREASRSE